MNVSINQIVLTLCFVCCLTAVFSHLILKVNWPERFLRTNAFGARIPVTFGIMPAFGLSAVMGVAHPIAIPAALLILGFSLIGYLDDVYGSPTYRGIRGHLTALRNGTFTTGLLKLVASPLMAGIFSLYTHGLQSWVAYLNIIMIAASSNAFNLLDLRPGRSQGFAVITLLILLPFVQLPVAVGSLLVLLITIIPDARAKVMMGDSGAIAIGTGVALVVIASSNILVAVAYTVAAVTLNVVAEKYSLGKLISQNIVLNKIDGLLGRRS